MKGLYKVEFHTEQESGRGVIYAHEGRLLGGNSAVAFVGSYDDTGELISIEIATHRHNDDLQARSLFGLDRISLSLRGRQHGDQLQFEGRAAELPGVSITCTMIPISDEASSPPAPAAGSDGIRKGLYCINIRMLDGVHGGNTGVMVLHDGRIRGGDAFFAYLGSYSSANGKWKGEILNQEHTPSQGERPLFGGREVGIGFSGTYTDTAADGDATALAGKRSIRFRAALRMLVEM